MKAFEVFLNGKQLCIAGIGDDGVLNTMIDHVVGHGHDHLHVNVGGLDTTTDEFVYWIEHAELAIGDEIRIIIVDVKSVDKPKRRVKKKSN